MWRLVDFASPKNPRVSATAGNETLGARTFLVLVLACSLLGGGCIWKLWSKEPPPEERIYDVYGTVETITKDTLVVNTKKGQRLEFSMLDSSIKGSDFGPGTYVHVYYRQIEGKPEVTMVVEKRD